MLSWSMDVGFGRKVFVRVADAGRGRVGNEVLGFDSFECIWMYGGGVLGKGIFLL